MKVTIALFTLLLLSGCANQKSVIISDYCQIAQPVRVSHADTRLTKEQADREYKKYVAACK